MKLKNFTKMSSMVLFVVLGSMMVVTSCSEDDPVVLEDPIAQFSFVAAGSTITFTNVSEHATSYSWDFGDETGTSTDQNPVYTYASAGDFEVTLTASNGVMEVSITKTVSTQNSGALAAAIVGKEWIAARGDTYAYALGGAADAGTGWDDRTPPWWNFGDGNGHSYLRHRPALINDVYVFEIDGTMNVDFNGDFWTEYHLWTDTDANETNFDLANGLPANANGEDMSAFSNPDGLWTFEVDENESTIRCIGAGAHILNPRVVYSAQSPAEVTTPQAEVWYDIVRVVEVAGAADTLVLYASANDGANDVGQFITLHAYENEGDIPPPDPEPCEISRSGTQAASGFAHTYVTEDGGSGMASINADYIASYGATAGGETCTQFDIFKDAGHQVWGNLMMRGGTTGECQDGTESYVDDITFDGNEYVVKFDIYIPTEGNDFAGTDLVNTVVVRWLDESQYGSQFWEHYVLITKNDLALDTWNALEYDFSVGDDNGTVLADVIADGSMVPDALQIDFGGDNHSANGTFYLKNFRVEAAAD